MREHRARRGEEGERVQRERRRRCPPTRDEHAAERRAGEPQRDRPHELVERVGLGQLVGRQDLGHDRVEGRGEERAARAVDGDEHDMCHSSSMPVSASAAMTADGEAAREVGGEHERGAGRAGR